MVKKIAAICLALVSLLLLPTACGGEQQKETEKKSAAVDVDLASADPAVQYQTSLEIQQNFDAYVGKTVALSGTYQENEWHFIIVQDITLCCYVYFEIVADDYPDAGSEIEVTGTFGYYADGKGEYPYIKVDRLTVTAPPAQA